MAAKLGLVLDCADPDKLAEFWSAAIGYTRLGGAGNYVLLVDETASNPSSSCSASTNRRPARTECTSTSKHRPSTKKPHGWKVSVHDASRTRPSRSTATDGW